jgi:hypothetical protein
MSPEPRSRRAGRLGFASLLIAFGGFLVLGAGGSRGVVVPVFWVLQGIAVALALVVVFWRGPAMPAWGRALAALTLVGEALFVWVLARGLSQLT